MKVIVKILQGGEYSVEVKPTTYIADIKREIFERLHIPVEQQKLLLLGRTLADEQTVQSYPLIKDGTKLNLIVKKPEGLLEASMKYFKESGMSDVEAASTARRLVNILDEKVNLMSLDDIERLCLDCLLDEQGQNRASSIVDNEPEGDDIFGL